MKRKVRFKLYNEVFVDVFSFLEKEFSSKTYKAISAYEHILNNYNTINSIHRVGQESNGLNFLEALDPIEVTVPIGDFAIEINGKLYLSNGAKYCQVLDIDNDILDIVMVYKDSVSNDEVFDELINKLKKLKENPNLQ